ncbi:hypothetical protein K435DRAFT_858625 [Dendrothele bispora CBS 962.96]|uniref:Uncharacterized protein n=1 Tax=Dendrothele bispora (strain CBS 962.96) TaxID=1314807 RepID=A0A4S8M3D7_DENBC|nr:hypothetical protein K435DRAFT_858625 [Dendrothele bispora CBS 962.96]
MAKKIKDKSDANANATSKSKGKKRSRDQVDDPNDDEAAATQTPSTSEPTNEPATKRKKSGMTADEWEEPNADKSDEEILNAFMASLKVNNENGTYNHFQMPPTIIKDGDIRKFEF